MLSWSSEKVSRKSWSKEISSGPCFPVVTLRMRGQALPRLHAPTSTTPFSASLCRGHLLSLPPLKTCFSQPEAVP